MWCIGVIVAYCITPPLAATAGATFCQIAHPIQWSVNDTRLTKEQVDRFNRIGKKLCGWGKRK